MSKVKSGFVLAATVLVVVVGITSTVFMSKVVKLMQENDSPASTLSSTKKQSVKEKEIPIKEEEEIEPEVANVFQSTEYEAPQQPVKNDPSPSEYVDSNMTCFYNKFTHSDEISLWLTFTSAWLGQFSVPQTTVTYHIELNGDLSQIEGVPTGSKTITLNEGGGGKTDTHKISGLGDRSIMARYVITSPFNYTSEWIAVSENACP